jgi:hypothetical protein
MMGNPAVHFEVTGEDPEKLRSFYEGLFDGSSTRALPSHR